MSIEYPRVTREEDIKEFIETTVEGAKRPYDIKIYQSLIIWLVDKIHDASYEMGERKYIVERRQKKEEDQ